MTLEKLKKEFINLATEHGELEANSQYEQTDEIDEDISRLVRKIKEKEPDIHIVLSDLLDHENLWVVMKAAHFLFLAKGREPETYLRKIEEIKKLDMPFSGLYAEILLLGLPSDGLRYIE